MKTAIAEADPVRAAMDREKYVIEGLSTQNFYKETTKSTGYTKASRQNLRDLRPFWLVQLPLGSNHVI
jgi:hypothetical protein